MYAHPLFTRLEGRIIYEVDGLARIYMVLIVVAYVMYAVDA